MNFPCPICSSERKTLEAACQRCGWTPSPQRTLHASAVGSVNAEPSVPLSRFRIQIEGKKLVIEWLMRHLGRNILLTIWWLGWTPCVVVATADLSRESPSAVFLLIPAYFPIVFVPLICLLHSSPERIEIDATTYRHYFPSYPWFLPRRWATAELTSVEFRIDSEGDSQIQVKKGRSGDIIWTPDRPLQRIIFDALRKHLNSTGSKVEFVDLMGS